jgi:hypothetical protein
VQERAVPRDENASDYALSSEVLEMGRVRTWIVSSSEGPVVTVVVCI